MVEGELAGLWIVIGVVFVALLGMTCYLGYRVEMLARDVRELQREAAPRPAGRHAP